MRVGTRLVSFRFFAQTNRLELGWLIVGQVRERHVFSAVGKAALRDATRLLYAKERKISLNHFPIFSYNFRLCCFSSATIFFFLSIVTKIKAVGGKDK